jgi:hypothetical protein
MPYYLSFAHTISIGCVHCDKVSLIKFCGLPLRLCIRRSVRAGVLVAGAKVRVRPGVTPSCGWGAVSASSVGTYVARYFLH